jgi:hypothetical protein
LSERNIEREYLGYCLKQYLRIYLLIFYNEETHEIRNGAELSEVIVFLNINIVSPITQLYKTTSTKFIPNILQICIRTYCFRNQLLQVEEYSDISCSDEQFYHDFVTYLDSRNFEEHVFHADIYFILIYYDCCMEMLKDEVLSVFPNEIIILTEKLSDIVYEYVEKGRKPIEENLRKKNMNEEDIKEKLNKLDEISNKKLDKYYDDFMEVLKEQVITRVVKFNDSKKTKEGGNIKKRRTKKLQKFFKYKKTINRKKHMKSNRTRRR